jgi:hypothetical protein
MLISAAVQLQRCNVRLQQKKDDFFIHNNLPFSNIILKMNVERSLLTDIKTKQLQWYGHVQRMEEGRLTKEVIKWRPPGRRKQGRPKLTWAEGIRGLMGERRLME